MSGGIIGIIGGTGVTRWPELAESRRQVVRTPYGEPSGALTFGRLGECSVVFLPRHGAGHSIPPHQVNYRANIWALHAQGVRHLLAVAAVGGISPALGPGALAVPSQILDYTWGRRSTFFDGGDQPVTHIDFTHPYDGDLRRAILDAAQALGESVADGGVYATTQGPRLETAAEIDRLERDGATMVGMTGMPEAALARELSIAYATLAVSVNHAAGRGDSREGISMEQIMAVMEQSVTRARRVLAETVKRIGHP